MNEEQLSAGREMLNARTRVQARQIMNWMEGYFDAYAWKLRAIWCFAEARGESFARIENVLQRASSSRPLRSDIAVKQEFDAATACDYDIYVAMMTNKRPDEIDMLIAEARP